MKEQIDQSWTIFLDRDGVINQRIWGGYVTSPNKFVFLPKADEAIAVFNELFGKVFVTTNQQCIAKGIIDEEELFAVHDHMLRELKKVGAKVDRIYHAPGLASNPNNTRKPKPAMALKAQKDFSNVVFEKSIMVGDTDSDILFGKNLGMKTVRILNEEQINVESDLSFNSLWELATYLK